MSYILDALKKDPVTQQRLNIDPLRQYHQESTKNPIQGRRYLYIGLALLAFVGSYLFFGGTNWIQQTWFEANDSDNLLVQEPLRAGYQTKHPLADYFQQGQAYNQQLVTLRREQWQLQQRLQQDKAVAEQQASQQQQSQMIAAQVDAALAKHQLNAPLIQDNDDRASEQPWQGDNSHSTQSRGKPIIELSAQQQEQISPELLAAFNQAVDETYTDDKDNFEQAALQQVRDEAKLDSQDHPHFDGRQTEEIPLLTQLPNSYRNTIPAIQFSLHMYSSDISSRWLRMNGQDYFEGGMSPEGIVIEEIQPQFVVMRYRGQSFRLPALSSW
ncbi:general secretion pathway protein GspB [Thalassotalea litorea]|uniref:general secretion pathway protein GspB n=1 Tax=Thalassotalea litorea TaxID=2020715 RepID=UPI0037351B36